MNAITTFIRQQSDWIAPDVIQPFPGSWQISLRFISIAVFRSLEHIVQLIVPIAIIQRAWSGLMYSESIALIATRMIIWQHQIPIIQKRDFQKIVPHVIQLIQTSGPVQDLITASFHLNRVIPD
jgi:hypothetical protein